jgi:hypothetical protein
MQRELDDAILNLRSNELALACDRIYMLDLPDAPANPLQRRRYDDFPASRFE